MRFSAFVLIFGLLLAGGVKGGERVWAATHQPPPLDRTGELALPAGAVVVNAWASWCDACQEEAQTYAAFEQAHPGLAIVGIDNDQNAAVGAWAAARWGWHHRNVWDPDYTITQRLHSEGLPTTWVLNRKHQIVATHLGSVSRDWLEQAVRKAES